MARILRIILKMGTQDGSTGYRKKGITMRFLLLFLLFSLVLCSFPNPGTGQEEIEGVNELSLDELLDIPISTAAKYQQTNREAPSSITIITSEDIERFGYGTLKDVFNSVRGFYVSDDRNYAYVGIRGFGRPADYNNRVLLLLNGTTLNENVWGSASIGTDLGLNLDAVERIEIVRGPGSALYGTSAMFAVVNIITKTGSSVDGLQVSAEMGSYGTRIGRGMYGREFDNGLGVVIAGQWWDSDGQDLYYREYDGPETNNGIAQDLDWDENYGVVAQVTYDEFTLQGNFVSREKGIPTGSYEFIFNDDRAKTLDELGTVELRYDSQISADKNLLLRSYLNHYAYTGWYPDDLIYIEKARGDWLGSEFQYRWDTHPNNRLILGAEYQKHFRAENWAWDAEVVYYEGDFPYHVLSFYAQDEYQITDKLALTFGVRWDRYSTVGATVNPRSALVYHPSKSGTVKLLFGEAFRAPNILEAHYEEEDYAKPNSNLGPEKIRTIEAIWEQKLTREILASVSLYNYTMKDLIDQILDPADELFQYRNANKIDARGIELGLTVRIKSGFHGQASYAFQRAEDARSNEKLTNSPSHLAKANLVYSFAKHFYAATNLQYESGRTTVYGTRTDSYLLTDFRLSTRLQPEGDTFLNSLFNALEVSLTVRNLFDVTYATPGGFEHLQPAITQNGRNYLVRVDYEL